MTSQTEQRLKRAVDYLGVQLEYSDELSDKVSGFLDLNSEPASIVVNARKPSCDHALTICHELGHFILHQDRPRKFPLPRFLYRRWRSRRVRRASRYVRVMLSKHFNAEWEADFWAFIFLMTIGAIDELMAVVELYPEKKYLLWLSLIAIALGASRRIEANPATALLNVIGFIKSSLSRHSPGNEG